MSETKKISEALALLEEASRENGAELKNLLCDNYSGLKKAVYYSTPENIWKNFKHARDNAYEYGAEKVKVVDRSVHEHPWYYIGGASVISAIIAYLLGRNSK